MSDSIYQIYYHYNADTGDGWRDYSGVYAEGVAYSTRDKAQAVADELNEQDDVYHRARHSENVSSYNRRQAEHNALFKAGLRDTPILDEDPGEFKPFNKYYVEELEVL